VTFLFDRYFWGILACTVFWNGIQGLHEDGEQGTWRRVGALLYSYFPFRLDITTNDSMASRIPHAAQFSRGVFTQINMIARRQFVDTT
jgi:hypothetical protein